MTLNIDKVEIKDTVEIKSPNIEEQGEMMNPTTIKILASCKYQGQVTQVQDGLIYVSFISDAGWVTQVFKPEELKEVK